MPYVCPQNALVVACALTIAIAPIGCKAPPVEAPQTTVEEVHTIEAETRVKDKVDLLFLIDDSGSMAPKQDALKAKFQDLIKLLDKFAADGSPASYHIGVVTSDLGADFGGGSSCGYNLGGKLQGLGLAKANDTTCQRPIGKNFIEYNQKEGTNNLPGGQSLDKTFGCMATVADANCTGGRCGCGFEMQLEAVYKALHDPIADNQGFLRADAILAVVFVTDEDDCSVDGATDFFHDDVGAIMKYGPRNSYRCARFGIACDDKLLDASPNPAYKGCVPATPKQGSPLANLDKYVNYFTLSSGVKRNPKDVILAAITSPAAPVSTSAVSDVLNCGSSTTCTNVNHSCVAPDNDKFFGDPTPRLSYVVNKVANHQLTSICQTDYTDALLAVGKLIVSRLEPACFERPLRDLKNPDCVVEDVSDAGKTHTPIPFCADQLNPSGPTCWRFVDAPPKCERVCNPIDRQFQHVGIDIYRNPSTPPEADAVAQASCATLAISKKTIDESPDDPCTKP